MELVIDMNCRYNWC